MPPTPGKKRFASLVSKSLHHKSKQSSSSPRVPSSSSPPAVAAPAGGGGGGINPLRASGSSQASKPTEAPSSVSSSFAPPPSELSGSGHPVSPTDEFATLSSSGVNNRWDLSDNAAAAAASAAFSKSMPPGAGTMAPPGVPGKKKKTHQHRASTMAHAFASKTHDVAHAIDKKTKKKLGGGGTGTNPFDTGGSDGGVPPVPGTVSNSAGAARLNRILHQPSDARLSYVPPERLGRPAASSASTSVPAEVAATTPLSSNVSASAGFGGSQTDPRIGGRAAAAGGGGRGQSFDPYDRRRGKGKDQVSNPTDEDEVGELVARIVPKVPVDPRSIGGFRLASSSSGPDPGSNVLLKSGGGGSGRTASSKDAGKAVDPVSAIANECLLCARVKGFETTGGTGGSTGIGGGVAVGGGSSGHYKKKVMHGTKARNKLRFVCLIRSTNRPLLSRAAKKTLLAREGSGSGSLGPDANGTDEETDDTDDGGDESDGGGYGNMFNPDPDAAPDADDLPNGAGATGEVVVARKEAKEKKREKRLKKKAAARAAAAAALRRDDDDDNFVAPEDEISSFPSLVLLALHSDGTNPDVRNIVELDRLTSVGNLPGKGPDRAGSIQLTFRTGEVVELDMDPPVDKHAEKESSGAAAAEGDVGEVGEGGKALAAADAVAAAAGGGAAAAGATSGASGKMRKERLLWSLLQIHAILCTSVVERTAGYVPGRPTPPSAAAGGIANILPPLTMRNVDRAELQYSSTVNGFLADSPVLCALLDRQRNGGGGGGQGKSGRNRGRGRDGGDDDGDGAGVEGGVGESKDGSEKVQIEEMDGMAYDMMMGNYSTRFALFVSAEEQKDAEEVLNSSPWLLEGADGEEKDSTAGTAAGGGGPAAGGGGAKGKEEMDAAATAETLARLLQKRMRDLEAETCRRLIAWEDEKHYSLTGRSASVAPRDTVDALSLASLFQTLDDLDDELGNMEEWLRDRAAAIKPLTDDCRDVEEENRQLEQQWKSYDMLGTELRRLLTGLEVPEELDRVLHNPGSVLSYDPSGSIDVEGSEDGVDLIHRAGMALKDALDKAAQEGGVHLRSVNERVDGLIAGSNLFCTALAQIVVTVMEQLAAEVVADSDYGKVSKADTHTTIAKKIRDTQRRFQSSLLAYIKLIEVLALLKPSILPAIRDAYSELVAEGILMKKRMKGYFQSLPGKNNAYLSSVTNDLKEYSAVTLRSRDVSETGTATMKPVNAADIEAALSEMLPVIAREAYFTAALFGLSSKHLDGREKKRNFESAKKSVDHSSQYFRYYVSRTCGIASDADAEGKKVSGDPMLSLVASIHLNEAMEGYIDREKKGGDHSLSLAYVRATILDLRKKVDKQWVTWVEEQIRWIRTNPNVPPNGKRAGVFTSFARFPCYLDHVLICCKSGRAKGYVPNLAAIKVVSYYLQKMAGALFASLHECAERETTDQQYAANVMRMENSYFFTQSIKQRGPELGNLFQKQITAASAICKQSTDAYLGWMIKREFKALHGLFSNISRIRRDVGDADVPIHVPRATFVKTLSKESSREVMREKIGIIYARMEKHLSEAGGLLPVAWKALVKVLYEWFGRWEKLSSQCYKFVLEPSAVDVVRIAKAAGGGNVGGTRKSLAREGSLHLGPGGGSSAPEGGPKRPEADGRERSDGARKSYKGGMQPARGKTTMSGAASKHLGEEF